MALGGGASRGLAHIPILEALDELGVKPIEIAGTSMGAIIGASYASGLSAREIRDYACQLFDKRIEIVKRIYGRWPGSLGRLWNPMTPAIFNAETLLDIVLPEALPDRFSELSIPLSVVTANFYEQRQVILREGPLRQAVAASSALPGILQPVKIGDDIFIDGGFVNPTPFDILHGKADIIAAVDVSNASGREGDGMPSTMETIIGSALITLRSIVEEKLKRQAPDILVRPDVARYRALNFYKIHEILAAAAPAKEKFKRELGEKLEKVARSRIEEAS